MSDKQINRLIFWNRFWLTLFILHLLGYGSLYALKSVTGDTYVLRPAWDSEKGLSFHAASDGPFVITHLVDRRQYITAALQPPLAYIDSAAVGLSVEEFKKLKWQSDFLDEEVTPPKDGTNVTALYYRPQEARKRDETQ